MTLFLMIILLSFILENDNLFSSTLFYNTSRNFSSFNIRCTNFIINH